MKQKQGYSTIGYINSFLLSILLIFLWATVLPSLAGDTGGHEAKRKRGKSSAHIMGLREGNVTEKSELNEQEGRYLLSVARKIIEQRLFDNEEENNEKSEFSPRFSEKRGTFVTLTENHNLRGCIGHIIPRETLLEGVKVNAINAAFKDPRFPPLSKEEWDNIKIEVSILTEPKPLAYSDSDDLLNKLRPGVDGVILKKGMYQATFLPQVWEQLPDKKEFLIHLCMKAGLGSNAWKTDRLDIFIYQAQAFEEQ